MKNGPTIPTQCDPTFFAVDPADIPSLFDAFDVSDAKSIAEVEERYFSNETFFSIWDSLNGIRWKGRGNCRIFEYLNATVFSDIK